MVILSSTGKFGPHSSVSAMLSLSDTTYAAFPMRIAAVGEKNTLTKWTWPGCFYNTVDNKAPVALHSLWWKKCHYYHHNSVKPVGFFMHPTVGRGWIEFESSSASIFKDVFPISRGKGKAWGIRERLTPKSNPSLSIWKIGKLFASNFSKCICIPRWALK